MVVAQVITQREDLADILKELKDINPNHIIELEKTKRIQAALTETELAKMSEARAYLSKYDFTLSEFQKREAALAIATTDHENNISIFNDHVESENTRLNEWETRLNSIIEQQNAIDSALIKKQDAFKTDTEQFAKNCDTRIVQLDLREKDIRAGEEANAKEAKRISEWESKIKAKAARLAAEAAS